MPPISSESELLQKARNGDPVAREELYNTYLLNSQSIQGLLRRLLSNPEDRTEILHDIFLQLITSTPSFRGDSRLSTYVYRVARVTVFQKYRRENTLKRGRTYRLILDAEELADEKLLDQEYFYGMKQARQILIDAIKSLPEAYRETLNLRIFEDLNYSEIAKRLNLPINTVSTRIHKGKKVLAMILKNRGIREVFDF